MLVNKIQNTQQNTSFKSSFKPSNELYMAFKVAKRMRNEKFVTAVNKLLNNGKNEIIEFKPNMLTKTAYKGMVLHINGEPTLGIEGKFGFTDCISSHKALDIIYLITNIARLSKSEENMYVKDFYNTLSDLKRQIFKPKRKK